MDHKVTNDQNKKVPSILMSRKPSSKSSKSIRGS